MPVSKISICGYIKYVVLIAALFSVSSCVNDDLGDCPGDETLPPVVTQGRQLLFVRVDDGLTRGDITAAQELDDVMVYLFDRDEKLVETIPYTSAMLRQSVPVDLSGRGLEGGFVTVWANIGNGVEVDPAGAGDDIDDLEVRMLANDSRTDFFLCPGDMFFGYKKVDFSRVDDITQADTVWIQRKNSRLNITVRGLEDTDNANDYYFRIGSIYSAYNFEGTPLLEPREIWEAGTFDETSEFVSPEPYIMIHNAPNHIYSSTSRVLVQIYKVGNIRADSLVASSDMDTSGGYIRLERGKTSNVLIELERHTGEVTIRTVITPWEEIHQWTIW